MIKIIIDSTTDIPKELMEKYQIDMVPLQVLIDGESFLDKVTITVDELYQKLRKGLYGKTSQPNPKDVYDCLHKHASNGENIVFLTISSKLSGTYQTIKMVSEEIKDEFPNIKIEIIDSLSGSAATGLMAIQAAELSKHGRTFEEIIQVMYELAQHAEHIFTIADLKYIIKSGRINKAGALIGNILHVKPILHVDNGEIKFLKKVRGMKKALNTIVDIVEERIKDFPNQLIAIMHADDLEIAKQLESLLQERLGNIKVIMDKIGSALGNHLGIGGVGVFFFNKKPKLYQS